MAAARFDNQDSLSVQQNENTIRKTMSDIRLLRQFISQEYGRQEEIETMKVEDLNKYIAKFIVCVRKPIKKDASNENLEYEPSSLKSFIASFERYFREKNYPYSIVDRNCREFEETRRAFASKKQQLKRILGKGNKPNAARSLTEAEVEQLFETRQLCFDTPYSLVALLWWNNTTLFGLTLKENKKLSWGDIKLRTDTRSGSEYLQCTQRQSLKICSPNDDLEDCRNPVSAYKLYRSQRPLEMLRNDSPFYLGINLSKYRRLCYKSQPMGINKLSTILKTIVGNAGIGDKGLNNQSARKTMIRRLKDSNFADTDIIQITGYRNLLSFTNIDEVDWDDNNLEDDTRESLDCDSRCQVICKTEDTSSQEASSANIEEVSNAFTPSSPVQMTAQQKMASRFANEEDLLPTVNATSKYTTIKTRSDVNLLKQFISQEYNRQEEIENIRVEDLNKYIAKFIVCVKKQSKKGGIDKKLDYEPSSLKSFISSFERYLLEKNYPYSIFDCKCIEFKETRQAFALLKEQGKSNNKVNTTKSLTDTEMNQNLETNLDDRQQQMICITKDTSSHIASDNTSITSPMVAQVNIKTEETSSYSSGSDTEEPNTIIIAPSSMHDEQNVVDENPVNTKSMHTMKKTKSDVKFLREFISQRYNREEEIESMDVNDLNKYIAKFIVCVRKPSKKDGSDENLEYEPSSLRSFISSFDRYLREKNYPYSIADRRCREFEETRQAVAAKQQHLKRILGKGNRPNAARGLTEAEMEQLFESGQLGFDTPYSLIALLWWNNTIHFGVWGYRTSRKLSWGDIQLFIDSQGSEYLQYKQHQSIKVWSTNNDPDDCHNPVSVYKFYRSRRPFEMMSDESPFYLGINVLRNPQYWYKSQPLSKNPQLWYESQPVPKNPQLWYRPQPMGTNTLNSIVKTIVENAGIDGEGLTNLSVRKTILKLKENNTDSDMDVGTTNYDDNGGARGLDVARHNQASSKAEATSSCGVSSRTTELPDTNTIRSPMQMLVQQQMAAQYVDKPLLAANGKNLNTARYAGRPSIAANGQNINTVRYADKPSIAENGKNVNTARKTISDIRLLKQFISQKYGREEEIGTIKVEDLDKYIAKFIACVKKPSKNDGIDEKLDYEPSSLRSFVLSFDRYLREQSYPYSIFDQNCGEFEETRSAVAALKGQGKSAKAKAKRSLTEGELVRLFQMGLLGFNNPNSLIALLWWNNTTHFGLRGYYANWKMTWGDIKLQTDSRGSEYLQYHRRPSLKVWSTSNDPNDCRNPVSAYKLYQSHRPAKMMSDESPFYLGINLTKNPRLWYKSQALGVNKMNYLMKNIFKNAGIDYKELTIQSACPETDDSLQQLSGHQHFRFNTNYNSGDDNNLDNENLDDDMQYPMTHKTEDTSSESHASSSSHHEVSNTIGTHSPLLYQEKNPNRKRMLTVSEIHSNTKTPTKKPRVITSDSDESIS